MRPLERCGALFGLLEFRIVVVDLLRRLEPVADHRHVAFDDGAALGAELLRNLLTDLLQHGLFRGAFRDAVEMAAHRPDEGDAHHADFKVRRRRMALGDREGVDDIELDLLVADGLARVLRQLFPDLGRRELRLKDERAAFLEPAQRIAVAEHLVVGRNDEFDVLQLGVGEQHRFGAQGDVVVGRRAALFRTVFRRGLRVQIERAGKDVGQELAGGDGSVAADRMEADADRRFRQQIRVRLGLQRHQLGFGIGRPQLLLQRGEARRGILGEELRAEIDERNVAGLHVLERGDEVPRLQVVGAETEDRRGDLGRVLDRRNAGMTNAVDVLARLEQRLRHHGGERGDVRALEHGDRLLAAKRRDDLRLRERLQELDRDHPDLLALPAQIAPRPPGRRRSPSRGRA